MTQLNGGLLGAIHPFHSLNLHWQFFEVEPNHPYVRSFTNHRAGQVDGVYVITRSRFERPALYVGSGLVADRVLEHADKPWLFMRDRAIVYFAQAPAHLQLGIERYLADVYRPQFGERHPDVPPISVNLPF